jgi:hypothetical protein
VNKGVSDFRQMQNELQKALDILDSSQGPLQPQPLLSTGNKSLDMKIQETDSLLSRCEAVVKQGQQTNKPILRVIYHFACSGGSLVSKCIGVMPNTFLLSEVHPLSTLHLQFADKARYLPTDYTTLSRYANIPNIDELSEELFLSSVKGIERHVRYQGGKLVLRDHSHVDFCAERKMVEKSTLSKILSDSFTLLNVVTIRNPIDAYLSLKKNGWVHFSPANFDEYCRRLLSFTAQFKRKDIVRYEDFVDSPDRTLKKISRKLDLQFSPDYRDLFNTVRVTGDSGRRSDKIAPRERRDYDSRFKKEVNKSKYFRIVSKKYGYTL